MGEIKILGGDFISGGSPASFSMGYFHLCTEKSRWFGEAVAGDQIESVEHLNENTVKKLGGTLAGAAIGAVVAGPLGAIVGSALSGRKKEVTFVCRFTDQRLLIGRTDSRTYDQMLAAFLSRKG